MSRREELVDLLVQQVALLLADGDELANFVVLFFDGHLRSTTSRTSKFEAPAAPAGYVPNSSSRRSSSIFRAQSAASASLDACGADWSRSISSCTAARSRSIRSRRIGVHAVGRSCRRHRGCGRAFQQAAFLVAQPIAEHARARGPAARRPNSPRASTRSPTRVPPTSSASSCADRRQPLDRPVHQRPQQPLLGRPQVRRERRRQRRRFAIRFPAAAFRISSRITPSVTRALCASRSAN